jgi:hypothetical protein
MRTGTATVLHRQASCYPRQPSGEVPGAHNFIAFIL